MARYTKLVTIATPGRDKGKQFLITELPADQGMRLAARIGLAFTRGGIDIAEDVFAHGWLGLARMMPYLLVAGLNSLKGAQWAEMEPLIDELLTCIKFQPPGMGGNPEMLQPIFAGVNSQIEDYPNYWLLLKEVVQLHTGFLTADAPSTSGPPPQDQSPSA